MTNLELAGKLQASSARNDDLVGLLWDAGAALRNLHTENTALRVNEENLRQELQECQDQRRAAFRRIEELDAMRAQIGQGEPDKEGDLLTIAYLHGFAKGKSAASAHPAPQQALTVPGGGDGPAPLWIPTQPAPQQKPLTDEQIDKETKTMKLMGLLDDLIDADPERAERLIASALQKNALRKRLTDKKNRRGTAEAAHNTGEKK